VKIDRLEKPARAVLPSTLDLGEASDLLTDLLVLDQADEPYAIDGSAVTRVATPCLQILLAALKNRKATMLVMPSQPLKDAIEDLGLLPHFSEKMVIE